MCIRDRYQRRVHGNMYALVTWFDVLFSRLNSPIKFTTSPYSGSTHWKQTVFYLPEVIRANEEGTFEGVISVSRSCSNPRYLDIKITYKYSDYQYTLANSQMFKLHQSCLLYTSPSPRDLSTSRMPSSA
eukprot:TRINITY_DN22898_c0_g1_i2.p1 TRINITY_DN22898_c0_g1~~TRINITY_DN22898_c0_g1_i2.p1  ORF type:complete len:129 (+),score=20.27 TRINITY_DN22898_c0_g1_i2:120-506(+)